MVKGGTRNSSLYLNKKKITKKYKIIMYPTLLKTKAESPAYSTPFYVKNLYDGTNVLEIYGRRNVTPTVAIEYSTDSYSWNTLGTVSGYVKVSHEIPANGIVYLRAVASSYSYGNADIQIACTQNHSIGGNIMSLCWGADFVGKTQFYGNYKYGDNVYQFSYLFSNNKKLISAENLIIPGTYYGANSLFGLFADCTNLVSGPSITATKVNRNACNSMFKGCTSLTNLPPMMVSVIEEQGFYEMFRGCTGLVTAPILNVTSVGPYAMSSMFYGCSGLTNVPDNMLFNINTIYEGGLSQMFENCTSLTTAPSLPNLLTTNKGSQFEAMFRGCTSLSIIPNTFVRSIQLTDHMFARCFQGCTSLVSVPKNTLNFTTLNKGCYVQMFKDCTSLTGAPDLPATTLPTGATSYWTSAYGNMFENCTSLTTAPNLPCLNPPAYSYYEMYKGCSNLNNVSCMATNVSATSVTENWLSGVAATGTFTTPSSTSWTVDSESGIPSGWTRVNA